MEKDEDAQPCAPAIDGPVFTTTGSFHHTVY